jgi:hypothetical protein
MSRDILESLSMCRRLLIANKTRDFAFELEACNPWIMWPAETHWAARSLATGEPVETICREDYNARRREWERAHTLWPRYQTARMKAMRPRVALKPDAETDAQAEYDASMARELAA